MENLQEMYLLFAGWMECGKTTFIQNLEIDNFFGALKKVEWVSGIELDAIREAEIQSCFSCHADFHYPREKHNFEELLEQFKSRSNTAKLNETDSTELNLYWNSFGVKSKRDPLIVMGDVSGVADSSKKF